MALVDAPHSPHRDDIWAFQHTHDLHKRDAKTDFYSYPSTGNTDGLPRLLIPAGSHLTQPRPEMNEANFARIIPPELDTSDERLSRRTIPKATMAPSEPLSSSSSSDEPQTPLLTPEIPHLEPPTPRTSQRVRFRSRVRITSGIHRPRNHTKFPTSPEIQNAFDPFAPQHGSIRSVRSRASSPSSSISVPLRTPADDDVRKLGWGPLGQRISQLACQRNSSRGRRRNARKRRRDTQSAGDAADGVNERTPLVQTVDDSRYYVESEGIQPHDHNVESDRDHEQDQLSREIDRYFGRWPVRLLNPHWWWWQLEPIVCCRFEEDDVEY